MLTKSQRSIQQKRNYAQRISRWPFAFSCEKILKDNVQSSLFVTVISLCYFVFLIKYSCSSQLKRVSFLKPHFNVHQGRCLIILLLTFCRQNVMSTKCPVDKMFCRRNVLSTKCSVDKAFSRRSVLSTKCLSSMWCVDKMSCRRKFFDNNLSTKCRSTKICRPTTWLPYFIY